MRMAWVLGLFTLVLIAGGLGSGVQPAAGQECPMEESCEATVTPTATLDPAPTPTPTPTTDGNSTDGGRKGQDGGRHGQDGGRHGREEGRPDLTALVRKESPPNQTTIVRESVTVRRVVDVVAPDILFPDRR